MTTQNRQKSNARKTKTHWTNQHINKWTVWITNETSQETQGDICYQWHWHWHMWYDKAPYIPGNRYSIQSTHAPINGGIGQKSPYISNVVLVRKNNGKLRLLWITVSWMISQWRTRSHSRWRKSSSIVCILPSTLPVEEDHKERTAFTVGSIGLYEYNKMPFGRSNSPAIYQWLMQDILGDYNKPIWLIYLDDFIIFSETFKQRLERLDLILTIYRSPTWS